MSASLILPTSATYCVARNLSAHSNSSVGQIHLQRQGAHQRFNFIRQTISNQSKVQALTYIDRIAEYGIPSGLLQTVIREDLEEKPELQQIYRNSTLCSISHCGEQYFVHSGGSYMDEILIRNGMFTVTAQIGCDFLPGFSTNIGQGTRLRQILYAGSSHGGTSSNIIVSTLGEIVHLQSVSGPDYSSESGNVAEYDTNDYYDSRKKREQRPPNLLHMGKLSAFDAIQEYRSIQKQSPCPILDPKGKWQLPHEIWQLASLSCHQSPISQSLILTKHGKIFSWTPGYGVRLEIDSIEDFHPFQHLDVPFSKEDTHLCGMLHPKLAHFSHLTNLATIDMRCKRVLLRKSWKDSADKQFMDHTKIYSVTHHGRLPHQYMISTDRAMLLMDMRNERCPISQHSTTHGHANMDYYHVEDHRSRASIDFYLARSSWQTHRQSQQIFAPDLELHSLQNVTQMSPAAVPAVSLLDANRAYASRWQVDRFAVIDRDLPCVGAHLHTSAALAGVSKADAAYMADIFQELPQTEQANNQALEDWLASRHNAVLLQQNALGDIYAQQLWWDAVPGYSPPERQASVSSTNKAPSNANTAAFSSSASQASENDSAAQSSSDSSSQQSHMQTPALKRARKDSSSSFTGHNNNNNNNNNPKSPGLTAVSREQVSDPRHSPLQWHGRLGERGRSPRAVQSLYRRFLQLLKLAQSQPGESHTVRLRLDTAMMDVLSLLTAVNPLLSQQLMLLHRCLQPSRSVQGSTMMHVKLHPGLRLPLTLPMPRDASAHRRVASVGFYRRMLPEDALQTHDVFLLDLRAIHLHKYPPTPKPKATTTTKKKTAIKSTPSEEHSRWSQSTLGRKQQQQQQQLEVENSKRLLTQRLQRLHSFLVDEYGAADGVQQVVRLSLFEIWQYVHFLPQCRRVSPETHSTQTHSKWSVRDLYQLLREPGFRDKYPRQDADRLSMRFEYTTRSLYARFSDGYFVTGVRPSRVDRVAVQRAFLRQQKEHLQLQQLQLQQANTRSSARQQSAQINNKNKNSKKRSIDHSTVTIDSDEDFEVSSVSSRHKATTTSVSSNTTSRMKTKRKMCECYWRLTTVVSSDRDDTNLDTDDARHSFCDRQDCVVPHHILFGFSLTSTSVTETSTNESSLNQQATSDNSAPTTHFNNDNNTNNAAVSTTTTTITTTPAASLLSQLIFQSQPEPPAVSQLHPRTPAAPASVAASVAARGVSQPQTTHPTLPPPATPAGWQHSDVTSDLVTQLLHRWDTALLPTPPRHTPVIGNVLRTRFTEAGFEAAAAADEEGTGSALHQHHHLDDDDDYDERDFYKTPHRRQPLTALQPLNRSINLSHFWELGDDDSD